MASLPAKLAAKLPALKQEVPKEIQERLKRGRAKMLEGKPERQECLKFWRGDQYVYRDKKMLVSQSTITLADGTGKPRHRVRTVRNLILDVVAQEVSAAISRIPGYEVNASTSDPEDVSAAKLAEKVCRHGYEKWNIRSVAKRVITYAVVADEGFAWPFWDSSIGPFMEDGEGGKVGEGEINVRVFGPNEVYWEPGQKFDESRWHAVEQARTAEQVYGMEGYSGGKLQLDADVEGKDGEHAQLVLVTEYLERPSKKYKDGRWITMANGKPIVGERPFPCQDAKGKAVDEPVLHKLSYFTDPDEDRDMGLVRHLLDAQRTYNDCTNKMLEWKNLALNPQVVITNGRFKQRLTDEPGAVYHAVGSGQVDWRPVPPVPSELISMKEEAKADIARIAAQNDIPGQVESGRGIQALLEKDASRRGDFIGDLAAWHSRLARHCLYLVQRHYTEPRLLKVPSARGPSLVHGFRGADLLSQVDVTVFAGSLAPKTREEITSIVIAYADRGWIDPDTAMKAIDAGNAEALVERISLDEGRANEVIQMIKDETLFEQNERPVFPNEDAGVDEMTGEIIEFVPGWMPRPFDRVPIHKALFEDWMKSQEWGLLEDEQKMAGMAYYSQLLTIEMMQAAKAAEQQTLQAEELGMDNASKDQKATPLPDQSSPGGNGSASGEVFGPRYQTGSTETF